MEDKLKKYLSEGEFVRIESEYMYDGVFLEGPRVPLEMEFEGLYKYYLRHGDGDWSRPYSIEKDNVICNYFGILFTKKPIIEVEEKGCWEIDDEAWDKYLEEEIMFEFDDTPGDEFYDLTKHIKEV